MEYDAFIRYRRDAGWVLLRPAICFPVGKMSILAPEHVRESYAGYLQEALDEVLGE